MRPTFPESTGAVEIRKIKVYIIHRPVAYSYHLISHENRPTNLRANIGTESDKHDSI